MRISDGRMSGTASGTIVLHVTPEVGDRRAAGACAATATASACRWPSRALDLLVVDEELARRRAARAGGRAERADAAIASCTCRSVTQADQGVDFDFLRAATMHGTVPQTKP